MFLNCFDIVQVLFYSFVCSFLFTFIFLNYLLLLFIAGK